MTDTKFQPGQCVTHPSWPAGSFAVVVDTFQQPVRARYSKTRRPLKPRPEDCEAMVQLDRSMPMDGDPQSPHTDDCWMECGLSLLDIEDPGATERCIACGVPLVPGETVLSDAEGGIIHTACCGPEREAYTGADGEPLKPGQPIPRGRPYEGP